MKRGYNILIGHWFHYNNYWFIVNNNCARIFNEKHFFKNVRLKFEKLESSRSPFCCRLISCKNILLFGLLRNMTAIQREQIITATQITYIWDECEINHHRFSQFVFIFVSLLVFVFIFIYIFIDVFVNINESKFQYLVFIFPHLFFQLYSRFVLCQFFKEISFGKCIYVCVLCIDIYINVCEFDDIRNNFFPLCFILDSFIITVVVVVGLQCILK